MPQAEHAGSRLHCDAPVLFVALGDSRGVRSAAVQIDGAAVPVLAGTLHAAHPRGFHADVAESFAGASGRCSAEVGTRARRHRRARVRAGRRQHAGACSRPTGRIRRSAAASCRSSGRSARAASRRAGSSTRWRRRRRRRPRTARRRAACTTADRRRGAARGAAARPVRRNLRRRLHGPGQPLRAERPRDQVRPALHRPDVRRRRRDRGAAAAARAPDPVPARRLGDRGLLPAPGEPLGARAVRGRVPRRGRSVHCAAHVLRLVRAARQPRRRRVRRRDRRPLRRALRAAAARADARCCSAR